MKEAEATILKARQDNYNRILPVLPDVSKEMEKSIEPLLLEALKKASIPIQRHKNSDWVDDSYLVIGKARYYKREDYENAQYTFKYINSKSPDKDMKHTSLIWLMRTYVLGNDFNNAFIVDDYLRKQSMTPNNLREYFKIKAWYHYKQKEYKETADNIEQSLKFMNWPTDERARLHYIVAQIRQKEGKDSAAYAQYKACIRDNPPYELAFYAKTSLGQVTPINDANAVKSVEKYFKKLLKDLKNEDYKDKIYYEMGRFELKQNHVDKAVAHFKESVHEKKSKPNQKAYGYLRLGEINYERLKDYVTAKSYYDSSIAILDTIDDNYASIKRRATYLTEFVKEYLIVEREDSLQRIARMDSNSRNAHIDKLIAAKELKEAANEKLAAKLERQAKLISALGGGAGGDTSSRQIPGGTANPVNTLPGDVKWYFANPNAMAIGSAQFKKRWGNRKLEDNWRRSVKDANNPIDNQDAEADPNKVPTPGSEAEKKALAEKAAGGKGEESEGKKKKDKDAPLTQAQKRESYLKDLPFTDKALTASNDKLRPALFNLAKIYEQKLEEPANAEASFLRLAATFPDYDKTPEALYFLYLMYGKQNRGADRGKIADRLTRDYPNSLYAKLILNPNYLNELKASNDASNNIYKRAYEHFEAGEYVEAQQGVDEIRARYKEIDFRDKLDLLEVHIIGRTLDYATYKKALSDFMEKYPKSKLKDHAKFMLETAEAFLKKQTHPGADTAAAVAAAITGAGYSPSIEQAHLFMLIVPTDKVDQNALRAKINSLNLLYYPDEVFTIAELLLGDNKHIIITVKELPTPVQALSYLKKQYDDQSIPNMLKGVKFDMFVISQDNFPKFYRTKNIEEYKIFFNANYDMSEL